MLKQVLLGVAVVPALVGLVACGTLNSAQTVRTGADGTAGATDTPGIAADGDMSLSYAQGMPVSLDHEGQYSITTPSLSLTNGLPDKIEVMTRLTGDGTAHVGPVQTTPEYTTSGTYLSLAFTVSNLSGSPVLDIYAASAPMPADAPTPNITPSEGAAQ
ncbi:MAG TPA: hypothetical protein VMH41_05690 [Mycobacteriales bacterium]|nr:hypothetical protein [Mycobacteriales bacterium]